MDSAAAPASLAAAATPVEKRLARLFETEQDRWGALDTHLIEPLTLLQEMIRSGGKRLRPAFCYWSFVGAGGHPDDERIVDVGAAFELLHAFALIHDDIMDGSTTRRGVTTVHVELEQRHSSAGWRGETRRFGEGAAILVGDLAHVYADLLIEEALKHGAARADVAPIWQELRLELNVGQYLDLLGTARGDRALSLARRVSRYKSGKYTIERPLEIGGALAGRLDVLGDALAAYGRPLGEAFQLRDDVLGAFGDETETGKPVGQDLREGKPTPLLATAAARSSGRAARTLELVGTEPFPDHAVADIQQVLVTTGALADVERRIAERTDEAVTAIRSSPLSTEARLALEELARFVANRSM